MTLFWMAAALMISVALGFVLMPLLRQPTRLTPDPKQAELVVYRQRLRELQQEFEQGTLSQEGFEQARRELEIAFATDLTLPEAPLLSVHRHWRTALLVVLGLPLLSLGLYHLLGARTELARYLAAEQQSKARLEVLEHTVRQLAAQLAQEPHNGQGWRLLGRSYLALGHFDRAVQALEYARTLLGDDAELLLDYAQALASTQDNRLQGVPAKLIEQALQLAPQHPRALWLAALNALQQEQWGEARAYLARLAPLVDMHSEVGQVVKAYLERLASPPLAQASSPQAVVDASPSRIQVRVSLDPALNTAVAATDTVFVFARAPQGLPMPLAVARVQVKDLPLTVVLDDSNTLLPGRRLSSFTEVVVGARVSRSGNPVATSGDLEGYVDRAVATSKPQAVSVTINRRVP